MTKRNKNLEAIRNMALLKEGEEYIGAFKAGTKMQFWMPLLLGPFAESLTERYQIVVTNQRILLGKCSITGKVSSVDCVSFSEIESISITDIPLAYRIVFLFGNGKSLDLQAYRKAYKAPEGILFEEKLESYLSNVVA